jgi:hypothetical protein
MAASTGLATSARAATFTVGTSKDLTEPCASPASGTCSLRQLIDYEDELTAAPSPPDTIVVPKGTYSLTNGELEITRSLSISGADARSTHVEVPAGAALGRVFAVVAPSEGGAPAVLISGLEISGGTAGESNGFFGGDVYNAGNLTLDEDWITEGTASSGGGVSNNTGTLLVERSLVSGNHASGGDSGAIQNHGSRVCLRVACFPGQKAVLTVEDSTIADNEATEGAGIFSWSDAADGNEVSVIDSTIVDNTTKGVIGGPVAEPGAGLLVSDGTADVSGSIIALNDEAGETSVESNCAATGSGKIASLGYNLVDTSDCGFASTGDLQEVSPDFVSSSSEPQDNGGATNTFALEPTSVGVDAIPTSVGVCRGTDQRGVTRPQGAGCDIGAVEIVPFAIDGTEGSKFSGTVAAQPPCGVYDEPTPTINWGDGLMTPGTVTDIGISGSHAYTTAGTYNGSVTYHNDCEPGVHTVAFQAKVADAALTASGVPVNASAGTAVTATVATFSDADPAGVVSDYTASINWGDGASSAGTVTALGTGFAVAGTHTYAHGGTYQIAVTISDVGGATVVAISSADVAVPVGSGVLGAKSATAGPATLATLPPPVLGKTFNVDVISGKVFVSLPEGYVSLSLAGSLQADLAAPLQGIESLGKGLHFIPLTEARQIPVGSALDTTAGEAAIVTATAAAGKTQAGEFGAGIFKLLQARKQKGLTELDIIDNHSPSQACFTVGKRKARTASKHLSSKVLGRLTGRDNGGRFATKGQYSAATVRGTEWGVRNLCDGTLTRVLRGVVSVRDFRLRKTITLRAGQHYLAKAPA